LIERLNLLGNEGWELSGIYRGGKMFQTGKYHATHNRKNEQGDPIAKYDLPCVKMFSTKDGDTLTVFGLGIAEKGTSHSQGSAILKNIKIGEDDGEWTPDPTENTLAWEEERHEMVAWIGKAEARLENLEKITEPFIGVAAPLLADISRNLHEIYGWTDENGILSQAALTRLIDSRIAAAAKPALPPPAAPKADPPKK
jgi:hypothetical protein